jgi:hypothetical protein
MQSSMDAICDKLASRLHHISTNRTINIAAIAGGPDLERQAQPKQLRSDLML